MNRVPLIHPTLSVFMFLSLRLATLFPPHILDTPHTVLTKDMQSLDLPARRAHAQRVDILECFSGQLPHSFPGVGLLLLRNGAEYRFEDSGEQCRNVEVYGHRNGERGQRQARQERLQCIEGAGPRS